MEVGILKPFKTANEFWGFTQKEECVEYLSDRQL